MKTLLTDLWRSQAIRNGSYKWLVMLTILFTTGKRARAQVTFESSNTELNLCSDENARLDYPENAFTIMEHIIRGLM